MKKIGVFFAFLLCFCTFFMQNDVFFAKNDNITEESLQSVSLQSEVTNVYVVTANSAIVFEEASTSSKQLSCLKHKDEVQVEIENGVAKIYLGEDGFSFYKIDAGFVLCDLLSKKTDVIETIPNFNAKTNADAQVYLMENNSLVESEIILKKGEQIFLYEGYEGKDYVVEGVQEKFTAVAFLHDNDVVYGYLKTSSISPNGINPLIISCAILILAVVGIVFALVLMKRKKVKLKNKKQSGVYHLQDK